MSAKPKKATAKKPASGEKAAKKSSEKVKKTKDPSTESKAAEVSSAAKPAVPGTSVNIQDPLAVSFEAGQIFSKYDLDKDGKLDKQEFTQMIRQNPDLLSPHHADLQKNRVATGAIPSELVTNRILTHFDETAGVAISRWEVDQHRNMGNIVIPLANAYKTRYEKLRGLLTGKLLPKREHLLQIRRKLQSVSMEVDAKRRGIERETLTDTEQILERLRAVESMRQSAIKHQVIQIEEELQAIERIVKRVEQANIEDGAIEDSSTTGVLLTSAVPGSVPLETIRAPQAISMVELIHEYGDLCAGINRQASKAITVQADFPTEDFPRETAERLEVLSRCDKYLQALRVKDHMLWTALQEKDRLDETLQEERRLSHEYAQEVASWAELSQQLSQQILDLKRENDTMQRRSADMLRTMREHNIYYTFDD